MDFVPARFIDEPVTVYFDVLPAYIKRPHRPDAFDWRGRRYMVTEGLSEWHDFRRRGRFASNMRPEHAAAATERGSWGVGRFYFRVRTEEGRVFDLYYDRAPRNNTDRDGSWFVYREMVVSS